VDIYRLIKLCGVLVFLWVVEVIALGEFRSGLAAEPPVYNVVDNLLTAFSGKDGSRPMAEIAAERGWDASASFVEPWRAQELENEYRWTKRKAWGALFLALLAGAGITIIGRRIWDSWPLGIAAAILGPVGIAWGMHELKNKG
jgi:hypothetical protein